MKRFIVTAALGAGLLVTPLFTGGAAAAKPVSIQFQKQTEGCIEGGTLLSLNHWTSDINPSSVNQALRDDRAGCGARVIDVSAGAIKP
jgi:hypothetical protein